MRIEASLESVEGTVYAYDTGDEACQKSSTSFHVLAELPLN